MSKLDKASNLELLIELMYSGKSGIVESLLDEEPIDVIETAKTLAARTGRTVDTSFLKWYEWYLGEDSGESDSDKDILRSLAEFKAQFDDIVKRIN